MNNRIIKGTVSIILSILISISLIPNIFVEKVNASVNEKIIQESENCIRVEDDFYEAINKEWKDKNQLREGCVSYGTFQEVSNKVTDDVKSIVLEIEENKSNYKNNSDELKVLNIYKQYIDLEKRNEIGIKPIEKYLKRIDDINNIEDVKNIMNDREFMYFQPFINIGVGADCKDNNRNILYIGNTKLALGNSDYYTNDEIKEVYIDYLKNLYELIGKEDDEALVLAQNFYDTEKLIAKSIESKHDEAKDSRLEKKYNVYTVPKLEEEFPDISFSNFLETYNLYDANKIVVENPRVLGVINGLFKEKNIGQIKNFLSLSLLLKCDDILDDKFRNASNDLKQMLYGVSTGNITENSGIKFVTCYLQEIVSKMYVEKCFSHEVKEEVEELTDEIIENFEIRLKQNSWMGKKTKKEAIKKLENISVKVGYPKKWQDYSNLDVKSYEEDGNLVENLLNIYEFYMERELSKINKKTDREEWNMGACAVNAYYNPINNEIVFPAAILQAPFYDINNSKEKNLGGIGVVIGHELTHAFDKTGCQFDRKGKLKNWWCKSDYEEFDRLSEKIVNYYSNVVTDNGSVMDGRLTMCENISDLGGMACVIDIANKMDNPKYEELFENYACIWREVSTDEMKEFLLNNDCHAPKKIRVNEVLSQFEEFYDTYNIKEGDKMYVEPNKRISMW